MPNGVPVATVAVNAAQNAGILAAQMIATGNSGLLTKMSEFKEELKQKVMNSLSETEKYK